MERSPPAEPESDEKIEEEEKCPKKEKNSKLMKCIFFKKGKTNVQCSIQN